MSTNDRGFANWNRYGEIIFGEHPVYNYKGMMRQSQQLVTIAAAAYTDSTVKIPAGCRLDAVAWRVETDFPTADSTMDIGVAGATTAFATGVDTDAGDSGVKHLATEYTSETAIRITPCSTPSAATGKVRLAFFYTKITPPTA